MRYGDQGAMRAERGAWLNGNVILFEEGVGDFTSGRVSGGILALDFHLEDFVGAFVGVNLDMRKEYNETFLEGAKSSFDFAFGLRGRGNGVRRLEPRGSSRRYRWLGGCRSARRLRGSGGNVPKWCRGVRIVRRCLVRSGRRG